MNDKLNEFFKDVSKFKEGLPFRTATYDEQLIINEKLPKLKNYSHTLMGIIFIFFGTFMSYFLFYEESKILMYMVASLFIFFGIMIFIKDNKTKNNLKENNYLVITGKCINKNKYRVDSGHYRCSLDILTNEDEKIPRLRCEKTIYNETNIDDEIIVVKINNGYKIIKK